VGVIRNDPDEQPPWSDPVGDVLKARERLGRYQHPTRVVHARDPASKGGVYIGRPTKWGNPFRLPFGARDWQRDEVITLYRDWLLGQPRLMEEARDQLRGKTLVCYCKPKACHGDVLAAVADGEDP